MLFLKLIHHRFQPRPVDFQAYCGV